MLDGRRRGGAYVLVLGVTTMAAVVGVGAVLAQRVQFQARELVEHTQTARIAAIAGLEMAMQAIDEDADWRETLLAQPNFPDVTVNGITVTVTATAPDGSALVLDDLADPIMLSATATIGSTRQRFSVVLEPVIRGIDALARAVVAADEFAADEGSRVHADAAIHASTATASSANVYADMELASTPSGGNFRGAINDDAAAPELPDVLASEFAGVFDAPVTISPAVLPVQGGIHWISGVLGPGVNTVGGSASSSGTYIVDGDSRPIGIRNLRLLGSLVIVRANGAVVVTGSNNLTANGDEHPVLAVAGDIAFSMRSSPLDENVVKMNLNPPGVPDASGATDSDTLDSYPSLITGLIWIRKDSDATVSFPGLWVRGAVIAGDDFRVLEDAVVRVEHLESLHDTPPTVLRRLAGLRIDPTSWTRVTD